MWEINRVRLHSIGPEKARYADTIIDLSGVGSSTARFTRPSPATVLSLVNGGGKSVLLKMLFSVVQPGRRAAIGGSGSLDNFVTGKDVGHVAIEWMDPHTGALLITGKATEARSGAAGAPPPELWYKLRPGKRVTLDTLPLALDGRMRTLSGFRKALAEAQREEPSLQLAPTTSPGEWSQTLTDARIDPVLFGYQRKMNVDEGEADQILQGINSSADFIKWLLQAITEQETEDRLTNLFADFAGHVARFEEKTGELAFLDAAVPELVRLAEYDSQLRQVREQVDTARVLLAGLQSGVESRLEQETAASGQLQAARTSANDAYNSAHQIAQRVRNVSNELHARHLQLRDTLAREQRAEEQNTQTKLRLDEHAWSLGVPAVRRSELAGATLTQLRAAMDRAIADAEPLRVRYAGAAANLRARHQRVADDAAALAAQAHAAATHARGDSEREQRRARELTGHASKAAADATHARRSTEAIDRRVEKARTAGHVLPDEDLPTAVARIHARALELRQQEQTAKSILADLMTTQHEQKQEASLAADSQVLASKESDRATAAANTLRTTSAALTADVEVQSLMGDVSGPEALDGAADQLSSLVAGQITAHDRERVTLTVAQDDDERVLGALGDGGLLPPRNDVERAVAALARSGVAARSGWAYLEALSDDERTRALEHAPHLVDGVIVTDDRPDDAVSAVFDEARLMPTSTVTWSNPKDLLIADSGPRGSVPVNPAMYDAAAAEAVRKSLVSTVAARTETLASVSGRLDRLHRTSGLLAGWQRDYPLGTAAVILAKEAATARALDAADEAKERADAHLTETEERLTAAREHRDHVAKTLSATEVLEATLVPLAEEWGARDELVTRARELDEQARSLTAAAETAAATAAERQQDATSKTLEENSHLSAATQARTAAAVVTGADPAVLADPAADTEDVTALAGAHAAAKGAYDAAVNDEDLTSRLAAAEAENRDATQAVQAMKPAVVERARDLLADPRAADAALRDEAARLAAREIAACDSRIARHDAELLTIATEKAGLPPMEEGRTMYAQLSFDEEPQTVEEAAELREQNDTRREEVTRVETTANNALNAALAALDAHDTLVRAFQGVAVELREATDAEPIPGESPYAGTPEEASNDRASLAGDLRRFSADERNLQDKITDAADAVRDVAQQHDHVISQARTLLASAPRAVLLQDLRHRVADFRARASSLKVELDQHSKQRDVLISTLLGDVSAALGSLTAASRLSRLPDDLGGWSGQHFLRIDFDKPQAAVLRDRVSLVADRAAKEWDTATGTRKAAKRSGTDVLIDAAFAAVSGEQGRARAFRVSIFQPDQVLAADRVPIEQMAVFSGGQRLTTGIIVYCTLAALRADRQGLTRQKHSGPLILDNPLGKANARHLIDLQLKVARALGVQLVFPSGLRDLDALDAFPLIISMRNDRDFKAGRQYVTVTDRVAHHFPDDDGTGQITTTRIALREPEVLELPLGDEPETA